MDLNAFRAKIALSGQAHLGEGFFKARTKRMNTHDGVHDVVAPAHSPYALLAKVTKIEGMSEERIAGLVSGIQIETSIQFADSDFPDAYLSARSTKAWGRVMLTVGQRGLGPSPSEIACIQELSAILQGISASDDARGRMVAAGKPIILASYVAMSSGGMGSVEGRLVPVGIFDAEGTPIWLHPTAVSRGVLKAPWPKDQKVRDLKVKEGVPSPIAAAHLPQQWYPAAIASVRAINPDLKGEALVLAALNHRVEALKTEGQGVESARTEAYGQYQAYFTAQGMDPIARPWKEEAAPKPAKATAKPDSKAKKRRSGEPEIPKEPVAPAPGAKTASKKALQKAVQNDLGFDL